MGNSNILEAKKDLKQQKDLFRSVTEYIEDKSSDSFRQCRYSILFYDLNSGINPLPQKEYGFHGYPVNHTFYISHCGNYLYFFQMENMTDLIDYCAATWCVILDINTLEEKEVITFSEDMNLSVVDSCMFNGMKQLYMLTSNN
jgi:hypothetical protein